MYLPSDDSMFFAEFLQKYISNLKKSEKEKIVYLDMGTGSGILSETAIKAGIKKQNIFAADIDKESVNFVKKKGINAVHSNLFNPVKLINNKNNLKQSCSTSPKIKNILTKGKFDLITFNAPYLPADKYDNKKDTTGGKKGDETAIEFLKQAKKHLNKKGKIFLLVSSFTPLNKIKKFNLKIAEKKRIFFEDLIILEFN